MPDIVKVSWSGGKDSTCALMKHIEAGHIVKAVNYMPMFTNEIPFVSKAHYDFVLHTADRFRTLGANVHIVHGMTYYDFVMHKVSKGPREGKIFGFPLFERNKCHFARDSKVFALTHSDVGSYDYEDIGIAADEYERQEQLNDKLRSILCEQGVITSEVIEYCKTNNLLSPNYRYRRRDGCPLCPHADEFERNQWFADYPEAIPLVIQLQDAVKAEYGADTNRTPLRGYQWFIDTDQIRMEV